MSWSASATRSPTAARTRSSSRGVIREWRLRLAPKAADGKAQPLTEEAVKGLAVDDTLKTFALPDPEPKDNRSAEDLNEHERRNGPLGVFAPLEPVLEVLGHDLVERRLRKPRLFPVAHGAGNRMVSGDSIF